MNGPMQIDNGPANATHQTSPVTVTAAAATRISEIVADETEKKLLRVAVEGGGCSGFQYTFELVANAEDDDLVIERDGATVLVDSVSLPFLTGASIDFVQDLIGAAFKVENPNASSSCGCGTSFTI